MLELRYQHLVAWSDAAAAPARRHMDHLGGPVRGQRRFSRIAPLRHGLELRAALGGDLRAAPAGKAPTFLVAALKDPIGANLDRYQIVKGLARRQG